MVRRHRCDLPALLNFIPVAKRWIYSSTPTPKTHVLYQELPHCAETRKQAFQTLLRGCGDVLTHRTRTAEPIQPSPACSRRARSVTETGMDRGREKKKKKTHENTDLEEQMCGRHERHGQLAGAATFRSSLSHSPATAPDRPRAGPRLCRAPSAAPLGLKQGTKHRGKTLPALTEKVQREKGRFSP